MENAKYNTGEPYWNHCNACNTSGVHEYVGFQEGFKDIQGIYLGNCTNCHSTTAVPISLETKLD